MDQAASVFRALGDPSRRLLLDRLFARDGQTLAELCDWLPEITRFGVMKHLGVLEDAGLVTTTRAGRLKRHFINPVPIRLIHDRWISKFAEPVVGAITALKGHLEGRSMPNPAPDHVYSIYIGAEPADVWRAITDGAETMKYFYGTKVVSDWRPGSRVIYEYPDGRVAADGDVLEVDEPRRLAITFHARWDPEIEAQGAVRQIWEIEPGGAGASKLTVSSFGLRAGSRTAEEFSGGIVYIVSGLKTVLETGTPLAVAS